MSCGKPLHPAAASLYIFPVEPYYPGLSGASIAQLVERVAVNH